MLPILRLIPVGGVFLAIAILLLALNPPRATSPSARAGLQPARGALLDRTEHPEWRQFLIQAALRRADEVERLRDLQDTVARTEVPPALKAAAPEINAPAAAEPDVAAPKIAEPVVAEPKIADAWPIEPAPDATEPAPITAEPETAEPKVTEAPPVDVKPDAAEAAPIEAKPDVTEPTAASPTMVAEPKPVAAEPKVVAAAPVAAEPKAAEVAPVEAEPETIEPKPVADEPKIATATPIATAPATTAPTPIKVKPENEAPVSTQVASIAPPMLPDVKPTVAAATPSQPEATAPILRLETNGIRIRTETAPPVAAPAAKPPADVKVAVVPDRPVQHDDDVTGSIEPDVSGTTIPVGIGEASSIELEVTLPRERPPVLLRLDRRARESKVERVQQRVHRPTRARTRKANRANVPPEFDFFTLLFKAFAGDLKPTRFKPPTIPYQPNNNWKTQQ